MFAVDLGASGGKCFSGTLEDSTFTLEEVHRFDHEGVSFFTPDRDAKVSERTFWDDTLLYGNIVEALRSYRRDISDTIDSIGVDTWGADGCFMNDDGEMLGKMYCYRDHRLDNMVEVVKSRMDPRRVYEITGIHFQPFNVSNQLCWFAEHRADLLRPGCFYLPVPSLQYFNFGGCRCVDSAWASVTQLMDAHTKAWSPEIMDALGIPAEVLPEIVEPGAVIGELHQPLAEAIGLNRAKLVATASHDTACAFAAAPAEDVSTALIISSGTWSLVGKLVPQPITNTAALNANLSNEGGVGNVRLLRNCMGTWLIQELRRVWAIADGKPLPWPEIEAMAAQAPAFATLIDPDAPGFFNPSDMEAEIARFCKDSGQDVPPDRAGFVRAVYESLAMKYRMVNEKICEVAGNPNTVVHIVGGGSKDKLLNQFTADSLGLPVLAGPEEATAVGNFMVQAMGLGAIDSMAAVQPIVKAAFPITRFDPQDTAAWDQAYGRFRGLCGI